MHNHFEQHLNLKKLILERRPKVIVECGAGNGDLTRQLLSLKDIYDFELHVITDMLIPAMSDRINWKIGLSYDALKDFKDGSIDLCIIDTDHNYWTLMKEFGSVMDKIREGGLIALHDVETFYHNTGMALSYASGEAYPQEEIEKYAPYGSLGDAMIDFLQIQKLKFKLLAYTKESQGAALIEKRSCPIFAIVVPGPGAMFNKKEIKEHASV